MFAVEGPDGAVSVEIKDPLEIGRDVKLVQGQRNVSSTVVVPEPEIVFKKEASTKPMSPQETILESERILDRVHYLAASRLTVGDLSVLKDRKRKEDSVWIQKSVNMNRAVTVGDLSVMDRLGKGLGELYQGCRAGDVRASMSESQAIEAERCEKYREQVDEQLRIRNLMVGGRDERLEEYARKYVKAKP